MKAVILAGGLGSRISEETKLKPKPMVEIGGKPIIWHIMKIYSFYGINDFIICCGYKGEKIKKYFAENNENWNISCVDTGLETEESESESNSSDIKLDDKSDNDNNFKS